jgi:tetraacyldisaccharide 4'-kinase
MIFFKPKFWDKNNTSFFSILFLPVALLIQLLAFIKCSLTPVHKFSIPIICVGNIYLGGTGKTPVSIELYNILKKLNMTPVFIRKEYSSFNDEVNLQKKIGPIYQNKKRIKAIDNAIQNNANVAILDDGFQDYSVSKNLSIICFNENQWIGNGLTIPAGPLREKLSSLKRANLVIINGKKNNIIEKEILKKNAEIKIFYSRYIPENIQLFKNKNITAFAGIGNPENFFDLLKIYNLNIIKKIKFPDHYNYSKRELDNLIIKANDYKTILVTTEKDYFRIEESNRKNIYYLKVSTKIENKDKFINEVKKVI